MRLVPVLALAALAAAAPAATAGETRVGCGSLDVCVVVSYADELSGGYEHCYWGPPVDWAGAHASASAFGASAEHATGPVQAGPRIPTVCPVEAAR